MSMTRSEFRKEISAINWLQKGNLRLAQNFLYGFEKFKIGVKNIPPYLNSCSKFKQEFKKTIQELKDKNI